MRIFGALLSWAGGKGPVLLVVALGLGVGVTSAGDLGYRLLPVSAFLLTLGSFLTAGLAPSEARSSWPLIAGILVWCGAVLPIGAAFVLSSVPLDSALRTGVLLSLLAPPVGSAAAIAAMMKLQPRLALIVSISLTLLAPLTLPAFAAIMGLGVTFDVSRVAIRLFAIVAAAALVALVCLKFRKLSEPVLPDQRAATGVAVVGLIIVGLAMSHGIAGQWHADRLQFAEMLLAAIATNFGLCLLTTLIFWRLGLQLAGTIGLVSGNRNVTLAWAAASVSLPPLAEGYVAACVVPVLTLPLIVKAGAALYGRTSTLMHTPQRPRANPLHQPALSIVESRAVETIKQN